MPAHLEYVGKGARLDEAARILEADARLVACSGREDHVRLVARTEELPRSQAGCERSLAVAAGDAQHAPLVDPLAVAVHAREHNASLGCVSVRGGTRGGRGPKREEPPAFTPAGRLSPACRPQ